MNDLINLSSYPVRGVLHLLLQDKTTGENIIWATNPPEELTDVTDKSQITEEQLTKAKDAIQPRIFKTAENRLKRTKRKGEVFTPAWICNFMNNVCDEEWFKRKNVFNVTEGNEWKTTTKPVNFSGLQTWGQYVDSQRLEITCGEAPYLVSRYDTSTGKHIPLRERIGILDRKMRIVNENAGDFAEWYKWTLRAFQSVYGYEYQGDNLLIARINLLTTFTEYYTERWQKEPEQGEIQEIVDIIVWNLWQMDGLHDVTPCENPTPCKIYNWKENKPLLFTTLKTGGKNEAIQQHETDRKTRLFSGRSGVAICGGAGGSDNNSTAIKNGVLGF